VDIDTGNRLPEFAQCRDLAVGSISTRTDLTDHSINAHPWAALHHVPGPGQAVTELALDSPSAQASTIFARNANPSCDHRSNCSRSSAVRTNSASARSAQDTRNDKSIISDATH